MSRITGKETLELFEAYQSVYAPRELTEEQIWEEVENLVNSLLEEGHDLSDYTWEDMYQIYIEEAKKSEDEKEYEGYGKSSKFTQDTDRASFRPGVDVPKVKKFGRISRAMPPSISGHATRTISANTRAAGEDPGAPKSQKIARTTKLVKTKTGWKKVQAEQLDAYDIVLMHLLDEGYASHPDAAEAIMSNMSEDWVKSIIG
jgi:hypothetical protein